MRRVHWRRSRPVAPAMATFKHTGGVSHFKDKLIGGMVERG
jgi:hypothetical protein